MWAVETWAMLTSGSVIHLGEEALARRLTAGRLGDEEISANFQEKGLPAKERG